MTMTTTTTKSSIGRDYSLALLRITDAFVYLMSTSSLLVNLFPHALCRTGVVDHQYLIADLEEWCAASASSSSSVSAVCPLLKKFLTSATDSESLLSAEARAGLVATVTVIKQASEGQ